MLIPIIYIVRNNKGKACIIYQSSGTFLTMFCVLVSYHTSLIYISHILMQYMCDAQYVHDIENVVYSLHLVSQKQACNAFLCLHINQKLKLQLS